MFESIAKRIRRVFSFLTDEFGMVPEAADSRVLFRNATTAVQVTDDLRDGVFVMVVRLVDGRVPPYPTFLGDPDWNERLHWYDLLELVSLRRPEDPVAGPVGLPWKSLEGERLLQHHATLLRAFAADVLRGDFSSFELMEKPVVERARSLREIETRRCAERQDESQR